MPTVRGKQKIQTPQKIRIEDRRRESTIAQGLIIQIAAIVNNSYVKHGEICRIRRRMDGINGEIQVTIGCCGFYCLMVSYLMVAMII